jgi:hypothetical protein
MTPRGRIPIATALKRREASARRIQDAVGPDGEVARLEVRIADC